MTIGQRIKSLRRAAGMTQEELGAKLGLKKAAIHKYETGLVDLRSSTLEKLAAALDTTPAYLLGLEDPPLPAGAVPYQPTQRIPILGRISAGLPIYAEQNIEGYTFTDLNGGAEYFALRVSGNSMNAIGINDGYLIVVRRQDEVENGEVAVVMVGDEDATVKRFYATESTVTLMPQSTDPSFQPQIYDLRRTKIKVLGKVVKVEFLL
ncbi:LexA family transcriptional regulator [Pseudoflavonifractor sp. MSJ-37]|uniref:LexA family protein n=1 Tax=Pseudoflavonifractor sp. MSJ-37 TaxID=2841531 RepID=UPI001C111AC6|nr:LexA family transcriptional regulator [Pseudoflavonifractor sp. MSJ-37]MBU5434553.1 helix-turn-helix domain-containing protein [Pseudoflavonifractor sp. MSJ-37]